MTHISVHKLLPDALKHDPENRFSSLSFFGGMFVMAMSFVLESMNSLVSRIVCRGVHDKFA